MNQPSAKKPTHKLKTTDQSFSRKHHGMSFYSSANFYLCETAPRINAKQLSDALSSLSAFPAVAAEDALLTCELNWGVAEQPHLPRIREWGNEDEWANQIHETPPDLELEDATLAQACAAIDKEGEHQVARAFITGNLTDAASKELRIPETDENSVPFVPFHWSLNIGPTDIVGLWDDRPAAIAAMLSFSIHGDGYFFPWDFKNWVERRGNHELLQPILELFRTTWPASGEAPSKELIELRRQWKEYWPYEDPSATSGWYWGPEESG